jgi:hypothetical protein
LWWVRRFSRIFLPIALFFKNLSESFVASFFESALFVCVSGSPEVGFFDFETYICCLRERERARRMQRWSRFETYCSLFTD